MPASPPRLALRDRFLLAAARRLASPLTAGELTLGLPSGAETTLSSPAPGHAATIAFRSTRGILSTLWRGKLGFAESYMDGDTDIPDLEALFQFFLDNEPALIAAGSKLLQAHASDRRWHTRRDNTRSGSRRNIAAHYDLGNEFYAAWLDAGMSYSSGIYASPTSTLDDAQALKHARIAEALELTPDTRLLEIGCGWGSVAELAARRGADVTGITISREQLEYARRRLAEAGLSERARCEFQDYRDTAGTFDRVVSIEMIEAVGEAHWPTYFKVLAERLRPGGHAVVQAITIPESYFEGYKRSPDFIQRYIFPGGMLPTIEGIAVNATGAGLTFSTIERFGHSYARTLRDWRTRFDAAWPRIEAMGFDERFRRMWSYYLAYCAVGFERDCIDVGLYRIGKP